VGQRIQPASNSGSRVSADRKSILAVIAEMLDGPIAFHSVLAKISGSVTAGLMLSQALYWSKVLARTNPNADGWFYKTQAEWAEETCMSRWEQDGAKKLLRKLPFWEDDRRGAPPKSYYRVDLEKLLEAIADHVEKPHSRLRENLGPDVEKASIQNVEKSSSLKGTETTPETTQRENLSAARSTELLDGILFSTWWESYPRKIDKPSCQRLWMALSVLDRAAAFQGLEVWNNSTEWHDRTFIPHPATFLKRRQWEDVPVKAHGRKGATNADERTRRNLAVAGL
jgi:hypothetical protein